MKFSFDECFQSFPPLPQADNLDGFWKKAIDGLRRTPVDPRQKLMIGKSLGWESVSEVSFASFGGQRLHGYLSIPRKRGRTPAVVSFHDYHDSFELDRGFSQEGLARLAIYLRGHEPHESAAAGPQTPRPRFIEAAGLDEPEKSYPYACYLDAIRCVDFLRLNKSIDAAHIGVLGRGFGAALAVFVAAAMEENVRAVALERPGFVWLSRWIEEAGSDAAAEIRALNEQSARARGRIKKSVQYLDALNWSGKLKQPVLCTTGLDDELNPPPLAFGFFNRLQTDKSMEIYTAEQPDPEGKEERKKSLKFLSEHLQTEE